MELIVNKLKLIHLKKLNYQLEKIKLIGGELNSSENIKSKTNDIIIKVEGKIKKITQVIKNLKNNLSEISKVSNKRNLELENDFKDSMNNLKEISQLLEGGSNDFNTDEEYDFVNKNIIKLDKLMKKYMDEDILEMRTKLLSLNDSEESDNEDSDSLYEDSDSIDNTLFNFNMMKNMKSNKNIYPLDKIENYSHQNIEPIMSNVDNLSSQNIEPVISNTDADLQNFNMMRNVENMVDNLFGEVIGFT